jgi:hypothetical protein
MKKKKNLNLNKIKLVNLNKKTTVKGGVGDPPTKTNWTRPIKACIVYSKDIDCSLE